MNAYVVVLLVYSGALIGVGLWLGRRVKRSGDFFVAGRSLGPVLIFATILAANIGAGSTVGATGLGYADGLGAWWWVGSAAIGTLLLAFWVGPRIRRMAEERGFYTVGDLLEYRYGAAARATVAVLLWVGTVAVLVAQLVALHVHLGVVTGMPKFTSVLVGGAVVTIYFAAGGLRGAASIHLMQLVILLGTFVVAVPIAWSRAGGWEAISAAPDLAPTYLNFLGNESTGWILLLILLPNFIISPGLVQKVYGAKNDRAVRLGVGAAAVVLLFFAFVPAVLGMSAHVLHPGLTPDEALPTLLRDSLPLVVGALGIGAIFMAEVSTADAVLFMLSTSWSQDIYRRFIRPDATDAQVLRVARLAAVAGGSTLR